MRQEHYDNVKAMLDMWADAKSTGGFVARGMPTRCAFALESSIQSFDDLELAVDEHIVSAVDAAVWGLPVIEREAVRMHYGMCKFVVWRTEFDTVFAMAVERLFEVLKEKVAC